MKQANHSETWTFTLLEDCVESNRILFHLEAIANANPYGQLHTELFRPTPTGSLVGEFLQNTVALQ